MHPFNNLKDDNYIINIDEDVYDELILKILAGTNRPTPLTFSIPTVNPIRLFQNSFTLKININLDEKVNIKVTDMNGAPVYLRQFNPGTSNDIVVSTSSWSYGDYNIAFTDATGELLATGEFSIR